MAVNEIFKFEKIGLKIISNPTIEGISEKSDGAPQAIVINEQGNGSGLIIGIVDSKSPHSIKVFQNKIGWLMNNVAARRHKGLTMSKDECCALYDAAKANNYINIFGCNVLFSDMNEHHMIERRDDVLFVHFELSLPFIVALYHFCIMCKENAPSSEARRGFVRKQRVKGSTSKTSQTPQSWLKPFHRSWVHAHQHEMKDSSLELVQHSLLEITKNKQRNNKSQQQTRDFSQAMARDFVILGYEEMKENLDAASIFMSMSGVGAANQVFADTDSVFSFYNCRAHPFGLVYFVNGATMDQYTILAKEKDVKSKSHGGIFELAYEMGCSLLVILDGTRAMVVLVYPTKKGYQTEQEIVDISRVPMWKFVETLLIKSCGNEYYVFNDELNEKENENINENKNENNNESESDRDSGLASKPQKIYKEYYVSESMRASQGGLLTKIVTYDGQSWYWVKEGYFERNDEISEHDEAIKQEYETYMKLRQNEYLRDNIPTVIDYVIDCFSARYALFLSDEGDPIDVLKGMTNSILNKVKAGFEKKFEKAGVIHKDWRADQVVIDESKYLSNIDSSKNKQEYIDAILKYGKVIDWHDSDHYQYKSNESNGIKWKINQDYRKQYQKHKESYVFDEEYLKGNVRKELSFFVE